MSRRGLSMVELVLALALLSALCVASVSWTTVSSRALAEHGGRAAWRTAAERSLDLVDRALRVEGRDGDARRERWRVRVDGDGVSVRTRRVVDGDKGAVVCTSMRLRVERGELRAEFLSDGRIQASRLLLNEVMSLDVSSEQLEEGVALLTLRLVHVAGESVERSWRFAKGELE